MITLMWISPGDEGEPVKQVQELIGVPITGVYDAATEQRVRGLQLVHRCESRDGCFDAELETKIRTAQAQTGQ